MYQSMGVISFRQVLQKVESPNGACQRVSPQGFGVPVPSPIRAAFLVVHDRRRVYPPRSVRTIEAMGFQATYPVTSLAVEALGEVKLFGAATVKQLHAARARPGGYRRVEVDCHPFNFAREHQQGHRNLGTCEPEPTMVHLGVVQG
jgi:hypothetical protein